MNSRFLQASAILVSAGLLALSALPTDAANASDPVCGGSIVDNCVYPLFDVAGNLVSGITQVPVGYPEIATSEDLAAISDGSIDPVDTAYTAAYDACAVASDVVCSSSGFSYPAGDRLYIEHLLQTPPGYPVAPLRTGYWPGGDSQAGFGKVKVAQKHNILYPERLLQYCITYGHNVEKTSSRVIFRCLFQVRKSGTYYDFVIRVVTNLYESERDGYPFGVVTAYCEGYDAAYSYKCPNDVNGAYGHG